MIEATNLKNGTTFLSDSKPYKVLKYNHIKVGRGGAIVRVNVKNLLTGALEEKTFSSNSKVDEIATQKRKLQYLYHNEENAMFMDPKSYEQIEVPLKNMIDELIYIKEGDNADILFWEDRALSIEIPPKVVLRIKDTDPGVKGNSASNVYKDAVLENGLKIRVPLFINAKDKVRVDTRTGGYVERAK